MYIQDEFTPKKVILPQKRRNIIDVNIHKWGVNLTFGEYVREKRKESLLSQREFAARIGVSPVYVSYFESGERNAPKRDRLMKIAEVLNLNEQEKQKLLFLAVQQRYKQNIPNELAVYIQDNEYAKDTLRLAQECQITDEDWRFFIKYISNKYL